MMGLGWCVSLLGGWTKEWKSRTLLSSLFVVSPNYLLISHFLNYWYQKNNWGNVWMESIPRRIPFKNQLKNVDFPPFLWKWWKWRGERDPWCIRMYNRHITDVVGFYGPCCWPPGIGVDPGDRIGELGTPPGPLGPALPPTWRKKHNSCLKKNLAFGYLIKSAY